LDKISEGGEFLVLSLVPFGSSLVPWVRTGLHGLLCSWKCKNILVLVMHFYHLGLGMGYFGDNGIRGQTNYLPYSPGSGAQVYALFVWISWQVE
jgi:hypothetical protein